ncbi:type II secretion system F family protein [Anatilimnocola sp. NA78]|uniref:hypothetical protein n=1 Tax=Anatilimnocola sp. NA78 TaxID=3415683 RepID=UPI003CE552F5
MPNYRYQALNADQQRVSGEIAAASLAQAIVQLEAQGLTVLSIADEVAISAPASATIGYERDFALEATLDDQALLRSQLARLLEQSRELLPPLRAFAEELPASRRRQLSKVIETISAGNLEQAEKTLRSLPGYWISLLGSAATTRNPGKILREFLRESQRADELRRQWLQMFSYPAVIFLLSTALLVFISFLVIPTYRDVFSGFGIRVGWLTAFVLSLAEWITSGRLLVAILSMAAAIALLVFSMRLLPTRSREWLEDTASRFGGRSNRVARLAQFTADLLEAELAPAPALRLASLATGSKSTARAALRFSQSLAGRSEQAVAKNSRLLTRTVRHALATPMPNAARVRLLREVSLNHSERTRHRLSWTQGIVEPLAIFAIGLMVGVTVLALFMPLINLVSGLS